MQVLIVESGLNNRDDPNITPPAYFDQYISTPSDYVEGGRNVVVQSGRILGGGSSVNLMMYSRPVASDIDDWNTEGWSFDELEPLYKKVCQLLESLMIV